MPAAELTDAVLKGLRERLTPAAIDGLLRREREERARQDASAQDIATRRARLVAELAEIEADLKRGAKLAIRADVPRAVLDAIREREAERRTVEAEIARLDAQKDDSPPLRLGE